MLEQWFFDELNPSLNILKISMSSLGHKPSAESIAKAVLNNSARRPVILTDLQTMKSQEYFSITEAARAINGNASGLRYALNNSRLYLKRYQIVPASKE